MSTSPQTESRTDRAISWLREHPLFIVGFLFAYLLALVFGWYLADLIAATPASPFIYDI